MEYPKLPYQKTKITRGYTSIQMRQYAEKCVEMALYANSVDWQQMTRDEIVALIPKTPENTTKDSVWIDFALKVDRYLMKINTWHL